MNNPKNNTQEVLLTLIKFGRVSIQDFGYLCGFRTRVSELVKKHGLNLESVSKTAKNRFGNTYTYVEHRLPLSEKNKAIKLYNQL
jgi:hypothetical protein